MYVCDAVDAYNPDGYEAVLPGRVQPGGTHVLLRRLRRRVLSLQRGAPGPAHGGLDLLPSHVHPPPVLQSRRPRYVLPTCTVPQSRQSAKPFFKSSELRLSQPLTRRRVCPPLPPPPPVLGGRSKLAGEREVGRVPIPTRGHTLWYSLDIRTLCTVHNLSVTNFVKGFRWFSKLVS